MMALLDLADHLGLVHLFTAWSIRDGMSGPDGSGWSSERAIKPAPSRCRSAKVMTRRSAKRLRVRA